MERSRYFLPFVCRRERRLKSLSVVLATDTRMEDGDAAVNTANAVSSRSKGIPGGFKLIWHSTDVICSGHVALGLTSDLAPPHANLSAPHLHHHHHLR